MESNNKYINNATIEILNQQTNNNIIYYSISQVATLLGEDVNKIKYYTNIFDDILKIEVLDKELRYKSIDIDNLSFLIKLKNKGMTLKEIEQYYKELPVNADGNIDFKENNLTSITELIDYITQKQKEELNKFKEDLFISINESNKLFLTELTSSLIKEQNKVLQVLKDELYENTTKYIDSKFDSEYDRTQELHEELLSTTDSIITNSIEAKNLELKTTLKEYIYKFNEEAINRDDRLMNQIRDFKEIMNKAYYLQYEIESKRNEASFFDRLFGRV